MSVFESSYAQGYDALYQEKDYGVECDLVERAFDRHGLKGAANVLDIGCGTGGHAFELARRGHRVAGVDLSPHMIDLARGKAAGKPNADHVDWHVADARAFDLDRKFDAAIMMFAVLGYLNSNADVLAALSNIRRHLRVGAVFACDFWYGPAVLTQQPGDRVRVVKTPTGQLIRATHTTLDVNASTAAVNFDLYVIDGDRLAAQTQEAHRMRYFFATDLELLLERAGFSLRTLSAFPDLDAPLSASTWNAFAAATAA